MPVTRLAARPISEKIIDGNRPGPVTQFRLTVVECCDQQGRPEGRPCPILLSCSPSTVYRLLSAVSCLLSTTYF